MTDTVRFGIPHVPRALWAGGYQYYVTCISALRELGSSVVPVPLLTPSAPAEERAEFRALAGGDVVEDPALGRTGAGRVVRNLFRRSDPGLAQALARGRVDVLLQHVSFHGWRPAAAILAWLPDLQHRHLPEYFSRRAWWRRELGFRLQLQAADQVLVSSRAALADVERWYPWTAGRVTVAPFVPAPPDPAQTTPLTILRERYALPDRYFFLPNQLWAHKGHEVVARALAALGPDAPVVISTGAVRDHRDGRVFERLREAIVRGGVEDKFRLLGMVPRGDVLGLMQHSAAVLNPSRFEGWSTTVEEAKMLGVPMLLSDLPVHREQAEGRAAFFPPTDPRALAALLADRGELGSGGVRDPAAAGAAWQGGRRRFVAALEEGVMAALARRHR